jgi:hypothetical protein
MIYCGSDSDFGKVSVPFTVPVPDQINILHSFSTTKIFIQTMPF